MAQGVERFFKAAIVDRNPSISSAALVSAYHLFPQAKDVVKRWVNETQEAVNAKQSSGFFGSGGGGGYLGFGGGSQPSGPQTIQSTSYITQYHGLGLLYLIRQQDRMAVTKMIQQLGGGKSGAGTTLKNPMALCMLIRYAAKVMEDDPKYVFCNLLQRCTDSRLISLAYRSKYSIFSRGGYATRVTWSTLKPLGLSVR